MTTYTIGQTAVIVGKPNEPLPTNTIRNWTKQYHAYLSPEANPAPNIERRYNARDIAVLKKIHELRTDRLTAPDIMAILTESPPIAIEVMPASEPEATPPAALPAQDAPGTAIALAPVLNDLSARIARIEGQTATRQRNTLVLMALIVGVAVLAGVIVGALIVSLWR